MIIQSSLMKLKIIRVVKSGPFTEAETSNTPHIPYTRYPITKSEHFHKLIPNEYTCVLFILEKYYLFFKENDSMLLFSHSKMNLVWNSVVVQSKYAEHARAWATPFLWFENSGSEFRPLSIGTPLNLRIHAKIAIPDQISSNDSNFMYVHNHTAAVHEFILVHRLLTCFDVNIISEYVLVTFEKGCIEII